MSRHFELEKEDTRFDVQSSFVVSLVAFATVGPVFLLNHPARIFIPF
jgi:hypothetical protein